MAAFITKEKCRHFLYIIANFLPDNFCFSVCLQIIVCPAEMFVAEKTIVSRKGRGVC